jgi:ElaA protein
VGAQLGPVAAEVADLVRHDRPLIRLDPLVLHALYKLRGDVFVVEQACPYADVDDRDAEPATRHVWLAPAGRPAEPAAYLRVLAEDGATRLGRIVTAPAWRGRGLAARLVRSVLDEVAGPVVLDAQAHLQGMYERLGFAVSGPGFVEDGIPHVPMRLVAPPPR